MGGAVSRESAPASPGDWMPAAVRCIPGPPLGGAGERLLLSGISHLELVISGGSVAAKAYPMMAPASTP